MNITERNRLIDIENTLMVTSGEREGGREIGVEDLCLLKAQIIRCKINRLQGYIVQHREYSQYFMITINRAYLLKIVDNYIVHL